MAAKSKREMMAAKRAKTKMDPEAHQAYLKSERERYRKRKELDKIKDITKMSEREKRSQRNTWRKCKREHRRKRNEAATEATTPELFTPEPTPPRQPQENIEQAVPSHQKGAGRRKIRREEKRAYRTINKLQDKVKKLENKVKNYQRQAKKISMPGKDDIDHIINDGGKQPHLQSCEFNKF
ncbi:hypothetical protein SNE40_012852 [Patella caerulea]|uniref:Uncharacterized protein n=1 Tax=Patella caerulea TaxID=87958 RepID=A0AAN8JGW4_PATCE